MHEYGGSGNVNMNMRKEGCAGKYMNWIIVIQREANDRTSMWTFLILQCVLTEEVFEEGPVPGSTFQVHIYTYSGSPFL